MVYMAERQAGVPYCPPSSITFSVFFFVYILEDRTGFFFLAGWVCGTLVWHLDTDSYLK